MCDIDSTQLEKDLWTVGRLLTDGDVQPTIEIWHAKHMYRAKIIFPKGIEVLVKAGTFFKLIKRISQYETIINRGSKI